MWNNKFSSFLIPKFKFSWDGSCQKWLQKSKTYSKFDLKSLCPTQNTSHIGKYPPKGQGDDYLSLSSVPDTHFWKYLLLTDSFGSRNLQKSSHGHFWGKTLQAIIGFHKPLKSCLSINITNASVGPMPTNKFQPHKPHDNKKLKPTYQNLSQLIGSPNIFHFCKILFCCVFYDWSNRSTFLGHPVGQHCWH